MGPTTRRYPAGTGWVTGFGLGTVAGALAWFASGRVTIGLILLVATGTALGAALEGSLATRPLTSRERRVALVVLVGGVLVGGLALLIGVLLR